MQRMKHAIVVALLLLTSICCNAQELRVAEADAYLKRLEPFGFSGAVLVMDKGKVVLERGYGLADRARGIPVTPDTLFDIGSIVKTFTATAILQYVEAGKISLDDTLPKFFPNVPADKQKITLRQLLTHTAGLPLYTGGDYELIPRERMVEMAFTDKLRFEPGSQWGYCNSCYSLLAAMLEDLSGKPYEQHIHEKLLVPAGMQKTGYVIPNFLDRTIAHGYGDDAHDGSPLQKAWYGDGPSWSLRGNGGFLASVRELGLWGRALSGTKVASERVKAWHAERGLDLGEGATMGLGWFVEPSPQGRILSHSGGNGWFANNLRRYVDRDTVIVFSTNNARPFSRTAEPQFVSILFGETVENMPPAAKATVPAETLAKYAGRYRMPSGAEVELRVERGQLVLSPGAAAMEALGRPANTVDDKALEAEAKAGFEQIARGDYTQFDAKLVPDYPASEEHEFWTGWFERQVKERGKFLRATPLWSNRAGEKDLHTYLRLEFEKGSTVVRWERRAKGIFAHANPPRAPEPYRFVAQSPTEFTTWSSQAGIAGTMRIEGDVLILGKHVRATRVKP